MNDKQSRKSHQMEPPPDHYTVAIICSLESQLVAIGLMFDYQYTTPRIDQTYDDNAYTCGCINGHNVVVANKAPFETGVLIASSLVNRLVHSFKELRAILVVGTAGGIPFKTPKPDPMEDIHLGDVVVGWAEPGKPSVVQWDSGISGPGNFAVYSRLKDPDKRIVNVLGKLKANRGLPNGLDKFKQNLDRCILEHRERFAHPGLDRDILFDSAYPHPASKPNCKDCDISKIATRPKRTTTTVKVHYGPIASGSSVVKDGVIRDKVRDETQALCIEMSAAGVLISNQALVIKGISDYADSHKTEDMAAWRSYAAATAAAFTRELLYTMDPGKLKDLGGGLGLRAEGKG
jgi:nucleoside phosphorylase